MLSNTVSSRRNAIFLAVILATAFFLRLAGVVAHDSYTDEAIIALRAIGLIDYDTSPVQTTPWQWMAEVPWWGHLSLHDHPLGYFFLQHIAFRLFGVNLFSARLPSVLAGIASVYLLFLIGRKLFNERVGLLAAGVTAVSSYHIWVSRLGIQDGAVIALILLALWVYLLCCQPPPRASTARAPLLSREGGMWLLLGAVCGIGAITKYTFIIVFPIMFLHALINRIPLHRNRFVFFGFLVFLFFSSPSWLYNLMLYRQFGHFDFQLSAALGQEVPQWSFRMGRELAGGLPDRFANFFRAMRDGNGALFNAIASIAVLSLVIQAVRRRNRNDWFLLGVTAIMFLWFFVIGSTYRFVVMIAPFLALALAVFFERIQFLPLPEGELEGVGAGDRRGEIGAASVASFFIAELLFSTNSFLLSKPFGGRNVAYAAVNAETQNYGWNQLAGRLETLLAGKYTALLGEPDYPFLDRLMKAHVARARARGGKPAALIVVYDKNLNFLATGWYLTRHLIYEGWPVISDEEFLAITGDARDEHYRRQGVRDFVYIAADNESVRRASSERRGSSAEMTKYLKSRGIVPTEIRNRRGEKAFLWYMW